MKKILLVILVLFLGLNLFSTAQDLETAQKVADNFLKYHGKNDFKINGSETIANERGKTAYLFNLKPKGFILTSADDNVSPVISYSYREDINQENPIVELASMDIEKRLDYYKNNRNIENQEAWRKFTNSRISKRDDDFQQWPMPGSTYTDGWIKAEWFQSSFYNQFCPLDNTDQRSVVGCVSTAMSMILDFHKYIGNAQFDESDSFSSGWSYPYMYIDDEHEERDFPDFDELTEMMNTVHDKYSNNEELTQEDIAAISFAGGVSVEMMWSSDGSGAYVTDVPGALRNKFGYNTAEYMSEYSGNFYSVLKDNMKKMQPAELGIQKADGSGGHAINADGYNTDDYYHLNFGWGTSNSTCWYLLPEGMPDGYSVITGAALNIEGGTIPTPVSGSIVVDANPEGTYITLEGEEYSYDAYVDQEAEFSFHAVLPGTYTAKAFLDGRAYYEEKEVVINEDSNEITFNLVDYDQYIGSLNANIETDGAIVELFENGVLKQTTTAVNDEFIFDDLLPGNYLIKASLNGTHYGEKEITVTADNQSTSMDLIEYEGKLGIGYSKEPNSIFSLAIPNISVAIKITSEETSFLENDFISDIRFKSPINTEEGDIKVRVWRDNKLVTEKALNNYVKGEWIETNFDRMIKVSTEHDYYVGYQIENCESNEYAFADNSPRVEGKGLYINGGSWIEVPTSTYDGNLSIQALFASNDFGSISGTVNTDGNASSALIKADNYVVLPNTDGNYSLDVKSGTYNLTCFLAGQEAVLENISIESGSDLSGQDFTFTSVDDNINSAAKLNGNFPNPFNPETQISFTVNNNSRVKIDIFNIRGEKIRTLTNKKYETGTHNLVWKGKDQNNNPVASGVYFYKMRNGRYTKTKKMLLLK